MQPISSAYDDISNFSGTDCATNGFFMDSEESRCLGKRDPKGRGKLFCHQKYYSRIPSICPHYSGQMNDS